MQNYKNTKLAAFAFYGKTIRKEFIRKVYSVLTDQLLFTLVVVAFFMLHQPTKLFVFRHSWLLWVALAFFIFTYIVLTCCGNFRRESPMNIILLMMLTLAASFLLGIISALLKTDIVLMALAITAFVFIGLKMLAFQTKWDFTMMGGILSAVCCVLLIFGFICILFPQKWLNLLYASSVALLFSIYIVYDTQMMIGGNYKHSISPEEYVFASLKLYVDMIQIF